MAAVLRTSLEIVLMLQIVFMDAFWGGRMGLNLRLHASSAERRHGGWRDVDRFTGYEMPRFTAGQKQMRWVQGC